MKNLASTVCKYPEKLHETANPLGGDRFGFHVLEFPELGTLWRLYVSSTFLSRGHGTIGYDSTKLGYCLVVKTGPDRIDLGVSSSEENQSISFIGPLLNN